MKMRNITISKNIASKNAFESLNSRAVEIETGYLDKMNGTVSEVRQGRKPVKKAQFIDLACSKGVPKKWINEYFKKFGWSDFASRHEIDNVSIQLKIIAQDVLDSLPPFRPINYSKSLSANIKKLGVVNEIIKEIKSVQNIYTPKELDKLITIKIKIKEKNINISVELKTEEFKIKLGKKQEEFISEFKKQYRKCSTKYGLPCLEFGPANFYKASKLANKDNDIEQKYFSDKRIYSLFGTFSNFRYLAKISATTNCDLISASEAYKYLVNIFAHKIVTENAAPDSFRVSRRDIEKYRGVSSAPYMSHRKFDRFGGLSQISQIIRDNATNSEEEIINLINQKIINHAVYICSTEAVKRKSNLYHLGDTCNFEIRAKGHLNTDKSCKNGKRFYYRDDFNSTESANEFAKRIKESLISSKIEFIGKSDDFYATNSQLEEIINVYGLFKVFELKARQH